jgi:hypothetical protein
MSLLPATLAEPVVGLVLRQTEASRMGVRRQKGGGKDDGGKRVVRT